MGMGCSCRKNASFPGAHKFGAAISGPRIAGETFCGHEDFSDCIGLAKNHPWMLTTLGCPGTPDPRNSSVEKFPS